MSRLEIDGSMLKSLLPESERNAVDALRDLWRQRYREARISGPPVPDRATLYRWLGGKLPRRRDSYLGLCGILDVDPFAALLLPAGAEPAAVQHLYRSFWLGSWRQPALGFLSDFFGHHIDWPPRSLAVQYFSRPWRLEDFAHNPKEKSNFYATVEIRRDSDSERRLPQIIHFAYCQPDAYAKRWIQFGYVKRHDDKAALVNISGDMQNRQIPNETQTIAVEIWFGEGPAMFRIASLHDFDAQIQPDTVQGSPSLRFNA